MNIQIFGTKKCNDTKKAQRYFKERGIKFQFIDMSEKEISKGEFRSVCLAVKEAIVVMNTQLKEIQSKKVEVYSLDQIEVELALQTVNPSLDLSFFVVDDEVFKESFWNERVSCTCIDFGRDIYRAEKEE